LFLPLVRVLLAAGFPEMALAHLVFEAIPMICDNQLRHTITTKSVRP